MQFTTINRYINNLNGFSDSEKRNNLSMEEARRKRHPLGAQRSTSQRDNIAIDWKPRLRLHDGLIYALIDAA